MFIIKTNSNKYNLKTIEQLDKHKNIYKNFDGKHKLGQRHHKYQATKAFNNISLE